MTPSKLKEQLMKLSRHWEVRNMTSAFAEVLIDILIQQQAALDSLAKFEQKPWKRECECAVECARTALAATAEKLKALGCENE
jgi:hypothetical protein